MQSPKSKPFLSCLPIILKGSLSLGFSIASFTSLSARETTELSSDWKFRIDTDSANAWESVTLPHDWSISRPRSETESSSGHGGYFQNGVGWYTHTFEAPKRWVGQKALLKFEGVYHRASVWINGELVAEHAYGYTPFQADITNHITLGAKNEILVKVDNSDQPNARWYTGSGIYRPVELVIVDPIHIAQENVSAATWYISEDGLLGTIDVTAQARNTTNQATEVTLKASIIDPDGLPVANFEQTGPAAPGAAFTFSAKLGVPHPKIWDLDSPSHYRLVVRSFVGERQTDRQETTFGIRTLKLSAQEGLLLNGTSVELIGANVHHDNGPLGAAEYRDAAFRKAKLLKDAGFNAVRTAHNPPSSDFLDACDHFGLLVIDEAFDGWKAKKVDNDYSALFDANWQADLAAMVLRDRNHPSVIMWSLGNEVYERGNEKGVKIAADMRELVRSIDTTRPITAGFNGLNKKEDWPQLDPLFANLDASGYNYELHRHADDHVRLPNRVIYSSESFLDDAFANWKASTAFNYVIGDFVWSGIDYLGEAGIGRVFPPETEAYPHYKGSHYPWHGAYCGDIDLTGFRKPISHYRNIVWDQGEKLYAAVLNPTGKPGDWSFDLWATRPLVASWTWPDLQKNAALTVEVFSRYPKVRLYLNGKKIGEQATGEAQQFKTTFTVPYKKGKLEAVGLDATGAEAERFTLSTTGPVHKLTLAAEAPIAHGEKTRLHFVRLRIADRDDNWNPTHETAVTYTLTGPARIATTGSAALDSEERYGANPRQTFQGQSLIVLERTGDGPITLTAQSQNLEPATLSLP